MNILSSPDQYEEAELLLEGGIGGYAGDSAVTFREVTPDEILAVLGDAGEDPVLRTCVAALRAYSRPSYAIGGSPANAL